MRPDHHRVAVDRHAAAEVVIRSAVVRGQLGNLRPVGGEVAGRVAREHVRGPAVGSLVVVRYAPTTTVSPSIDTLMPNWSLAAASSAVSFATCVQPEARSPGVTRREHVRGPAVDPSSSSIRPDHHRVAVDRHAAAESSSPRRRPRSAWQPASSRRRGRRR